MLARFVSYVIIGAVETETTFSEEVMKKTETTATPCHICGELVCADVADCYVEHLAERAEAHIEWVADCEDREIWRELESRPSLPVA